MTEFRGIKVVAVPSTDAFSPCSGCLVDGAPFEEFCKGRNCYDPSIIFQPASLHDVRPRLVATGGRKPSFPIKAWHQRNGYRAICSSADDAAYWGHTGAGHDILAVERADEGEEK